MEHNRTTHYYLKHLKNFFSQNRGLLKPKKIRKTVNARFGESDISSVFVIMRCAMGNQKTSFWLSPSGLAAIGLIGAVSYFLLIEHRHHILPFLPYVILLLCPLMRPPNGSHGSWSAG